MALFIKRAAPCFYCGKITKKREGFLQRERGQWFAHCFKCYENKNGQSRPQQETNEMGKLELAILVGAESKAFLANLTTQIDRLEALQSSGPAKQADTDSDDQADEDPAPAPKKGKGKASVKAKAPAEDDEDFDLEASDDEDDEAPAYTKKDLIAACRENREAAIKVLKKMKVASVHELKPTQYAAVMNAIGA